MKLSAGRADRVCLPNPFPDQVAEVGEADLIRGGANSSAMADIWSSNSRNSVCSLEAPYIVLPREFANQSLTSWIT